MITDSWSFWDKRAISVMSDGAAIQKSGNNDFVGISVLSGLVLDAGCGYGRFAIPLTKNGNNVIALDASIGMLDRLVEHIKRNNLSNIYPIRASITNLPFNSNLFDGVISYGTFYYIPIKEWDKTISEFARVLKKNGKLYIHFIDVFNKYRIKERLGEVSLLFGKKRTWVKTYYLPKFMIKRLLKRYFEVVMVKKASFIFLCKNVK